MSKLFLVPIDLNKNELLNARTQNLASAPGSPVVGQRYFDTTDSCEKVWNGTAWISADASKVPNTYIPLAKLAVDPLARATHTGTQTASTISGFDTAVRTSRLDQMAAPTAAVSMNAQPITNVATPTAGTDAANKQYVDDNIAGLSWKNEVRLASAAAGTLATSFANGQTVDGTVLVTGDRILLKDQSAGAENGIYTVNSSGAPTRSTDADTAAEMLGAAVYVANGTANGGSRWLCNNTGTITLGTTSLTFVQFGGGSTYTAGNGLTLSGADFAVGAGTGITVAADTVAVDTTIVVRKYAASIGDGAATAVTVTHNLGTLDVTVGVFANSGGAEVMCDVTHATTNTVTLTFVTAPTSNQYRVVVHG